MSELLAAALRFAAAGWPVFPCRPGAKVPLTVHGVKDATTDAATVTAWWSRCPNANIGLATGAPGPDVVDFDVKNGGRGAESYARLRDAGLLAGAFALVTTPSGGWHLYYAGTDQRNSVRGRHGVDFRSRGGYVLAPPSLVDGRPYEVAECCEFTGVAVDWQAIVRLLDPPRTPQQLRRRLARPGDRSDHGALVRWMARQTEGNRNHALYWAACRALETGADRQTLAELARAAVATGLTESEVQRTIASAEKKVGAAR